MYSRSLISARRLVNVCMMASDHGIRRCSSRVRGAHPHPHQVSYCRTKGLVLCLGCRRIGKRRNGASHKTSRQRRARGDLHGRREERKKKVVSSCLRPEKNNCRAKCHGTKNRTISKPPKSKQKKIERAHLRLSRELAFGKLAEYDTTIWIIELSKRNKGKDMPH